MKRNEMQSTQLLDLLRQQLEVGHDVVKTAVVLRRIYTLRCIRLGSDTQAGALACVLICTVSAAVSAACPRRVRGSVRGTVPRTHTVSHDPEEIRSSNKEQID